MRYKISFCIVCMNRLHHLKETLLQNIKDNEAYSELEFIILDYNSKDGMDEWIRENMSTYIGEGRMIYYRTYEPEKFSHSHAKNLCFKLASGDVVCSINADHYTGFGFADFVNTAFNTDSNIVLTPIDFHGTKKDYHPPKDVLGRVCVRRSDFLNVKGFDEQMNTYGFEDYDFVNRLELCGVKRVLIEDFSYLNYIAHDNEERYELDSSLDKIQQLLICHHNPSVSELLFLNKDKKFEKYTLLDNTSFGSEDFQYAYKPRSYKYQLTVDKSQFTAGVWQGSVAQDILGIFPEDGKSYNLNTVIEHNHYYYEDVVEERAYYPLSNSEVVNGILAFYLVFRSRVIMEKNLSERRIQVNDAHFGKAEIYKNFQFDVPLNV